MRKRFRIPSLVLTVFMFFTILPVHAEGTQPSSPRDEEITESESFASGKAAQDYAEADLNADEGETAPRRIVFTDPSYTAVVGSSQRHQVYASIYPIDAVSMVTYSIEDTSIAEIDAASGEFTVKKAGKTHIFAQTENDLKASAELTVYEGDYADYLSIENAYGNIVLEAGETIQLNCTLHSSSDEGKTSFADETVKWEAFPEYESDRDVLSVDQNGKVKALANGTGRIRASIASGYSATVYISVAPQIKRVIFDPDTQSLIKKQSWTQTIYPSQYLIAEPAEATIRVRSAEFTWTSSNTNVLSPNEYGGIDVTGIGKATLTGVSKTEPSFTVSKEFEVYEPAEPTAIRRMTPENVELHNGYYYRSAAVMRIAYDPATADTSTEWTADDPDLLKLGGDLSPDFRFYGTGSTKVTATSKTNPSLSTSFNVTIVEGPYEEEEFTSDVSISRIENDRLYDTVKNPDVYVMNLGEEHQIRIDVEGEAYIPEVSWLALMFEDSSIMLAQERYGLVENIGNSSISISPRYTVYAEKTGEETYTVGSRTFTIRVVDPDHEHEYTLSGWTWADDCSSAYATFVCGCGDEIKVDAAITKSGNVYKAFVQFNGKTYTDTRTKEETVEPTRIWFTEPSYTINVGQQFVLIPHLEPRNSTSKITITSSNPNVVSNQDNLLFGEKTGTVTMTATAENGVRASCTIHVTFTDVPYEGKYYSAPVYWAVNKGITNGYKDDDGLSRTFRPQNNCTREAVVTFLWRLAGKPEPKSMKSPFTDVKDSSKYYYKAVLWAAEQKIAGGYKDGTFRPDDTCLREHVVTFLYRYAGKPNPGVSKNPFNDVTSSDYYYNAALWANAKGIAKGYSDGPHAGGFGPKLDCLREHVVTFLYRYAK